jgi:hypothetical protein
VATSLKSGLERTRNADIGFIVCDLGLVEIAAIGGKTRTSTPCELPLESWEKLMNLGIPIVFLSVAQQVGVVFRPIVPPINGQSAPSYFCLKKYACEELFPTIVDLAIKSGDRGKRRSPKCHRAHLIMPDVLDESMLPANIHSMY